MTSTTLQPEPGTPRQGHIRVHLALLFVQITFGAFGVFGKYVMAYIPPLALAALRVAFAGPILVLIAHRVEHYRPSRKDYPKLALLGLLGVFTNQLLYIIGLNYTTAINATILMPSIPAITVGAAALLGIEHPGKRKLLGVALSVFGALVVLDVTAFSLHDSMAFGNLLVLLNCVSYAFFLVLAKPVLLKIPPLTVIAWTFVFGGSGVFVIAAPSLLGVHFAALPATVWYGLAFILLMPTLLNYVLNTWAIRESSSSLVAAYVTLQPVVAMILAVFLLHESFGVRESAGFVLIIAGLVFASRSESFSS
jgi:drug/metabolite transporter (DMT)-like permease